LGHRNLLNRSFILAGNGSQDGIGMLVQTIVMIWIISKVDNNPNVPLLFVSLFLMAISWGFQMVGHIIEGTHLTLEKNIKFMLIAPIWVLKNLVKSGGEDLSSPQ